MGCFECSTLSHPAPTLYSTEKLNLFGKKIPENHTNVSGSLAKVICNRVKPPKNEN